MKTGRNRLWRQDHPRLGRADRERPQRLARWSAAVLLASALLTPAVTAQAATGGASAVASGEAQVGGEIGFAPMRWAGATWYGPGLYGRHTACGQLLQPETLGVAHRSLPCGTTVKFVYRGRSIVTQVIDRGPYSRGNSWDLTQATARALGFESTGAGQVGYAVSLEYAANLRRASRGGR
jgi:Lytic transglycolase